EARKGFNSSAQAVRATATNASEAHSQAPARERGTTLAHGPTSALASERGNALARKRVNPLAWERGNTPAPVQCSAPARSARELRTEFLNDWRLQGLTVEPRAVAASDEPTIGDPADDAWIDDVLRCLYPS